MWQKIISKKTVQVESGDMWKQQIYYLKTLITVRKKVEYNYS